MKKILLFFILLLIPFIVKADYLTPETTPLYTTSAQLRMTTPETVFPLEGIQYNDKYYFSYFDGTNGYLKIVDMDGNTVRVDNLGANRVIVSMTVVGADLYSFICDFDSGNNITLSRYNDQTLHADTLPTTYSYPTEPIYASYKYLVEATDTYISLYDRYNNNIIVFKLDLSDDFTVPSTEENFNTYLPMRGYLKNLSDQYLLYTLHGPEAIFPLGDGNTVAVGHNQICGDPDNTPYEECFKIFLDIYDHSLNKTNTINLTDNIETIYNVRKVGEYIAISTISTTERTLLIYTFDGILIQKITNNTNLQHIYSHIVSIPGGFIVTERCGTNGKNIDLDCSSSQFVYLFATDTSYLTVFTGGPGELIFTIVGSVLMIGALILLFIRSKKEDEPTKKKKKTNKKRSK